MKPASSPEDLRQQQDKNTAALGTTALPATRCNQEEGRKKPSARRASQDQLDQRSSSAERSGSLQQLSLGTWRSLASSRRLGLLQKKNNQA